MAQVQSLNLSDSISSITNNHEIDIELEEARAREQQREREQTFLPPTDGGYQAWLLLAGCFVINVLIWGASHTSLRDTKQEVEHAS